VAAYRRLAEAPGAKSVALYGHERRDELVAGNDAQLRPVLFRLQDRRRPLARQTLEGGGFEQRIVELPALPVAQL
jgi:hypothetical protein